MKNNDTITRDEEIREIAQDLGISEDAVIEIIKKYTGQSYNHDTLRPQKEATAK